MADQFVKYQGQEGSGRSEAIWKNCPITELALGYRPGFWFYDDFLNYNSEATPGEASGYDHMIDTGCTVAKLATEEGGVVRIAIDATGDNDEAWLGTSGVLGKITDAAGANFELWWEARIRIGQLGAQNFFIGLSEEGNVAADAVFDDTGAIVNDDHVAFRILEADPDGLDAIHNDNTGEIVVNNEAQVVVANTWYKVGCHFDGLVTKWYVDGVQKGAEAGVLPAATDFPDGEELGLLIGGKAGGATAHTFDIDWWACAGLQA